MDSITENKINPWLSIWLHPRQTIQHVLKHDSHWLKPFLLCAGGILVGKVENGLFPEERVEPITLEVVADDVVLTLLCCFVGLPLSAALLKFTGDFFGGKASLAEIRATIGWSFVLDIWCLLFLIPPVLFFGQQAFLPISASMSPEMSSVVILTLSTQVVISFLSLIISYWSWAIFIICLAEVQCFSLVKAFFSSVLATLPCLVYAFGKLMLSSVN